jgi:hypothetical protein
VKTILALTITLSLASTTLAGTRSILINGELFNVWHSCNNIVITGPDGYRASGYRSAGSINWTVDQGSCPFSPLGLIDIHWDDKD